MDEIAREMCRTRWRRARESLNLIDVGRDDFGTGGLGRNMPHLAVRLLILPGDPAPLKAGSVWSSFRTASRNPPTWSSGYRCFSSWTTTSWSLGIEEKAHTGDLCRR